MNEILIIRHYSFDDVFLKGDYDIEILLNGVLIKAGYYTKMESFVEGYCQAIKDTHVFTSYKEKVLNDML